METLPSPCAERWAWGLGGCDCQWNRYRAAERRRSAVNREEKSGCMTRGAKIVNKDTQSKQIFHIHINSTKNKFDESLLFTLFPNFLAISGEDEKGSSNFTKKILLSFFLLLLSCFLTLFDLISSQSVGDKTTTTSTSLSESNTPQISHKSTINLFISIITTKSARKYRIASTLLISSYLLT